MQHWLNSLLRSNAVVKKALVLCCLFLSICKATADHLPANLLTHGKPEEILAGISLAHGDADVVLKSLGPPTRKVTVPNNPQWTGYAWETPGNRLEVEISRGKDKNYIDRVTVVLLGGASASGAPAGRDATGRGLRLGDSLAQLKKIYGNRFKLGKQADVPVNTPPFLSLPGVQTATLQWTPLEFTLTAGFDAGGRIIALSLSPPECYPGGCA
jgi:hypothetical protein